MEDISAQLTLDDSLPKPGPRSRALGLDPLLVEGARDVADGDDRLVVLAQLLQRVEGGAAEHNRGLEEHVTDGRCRAVLLAECVDPVPRLALFVAAGSFDSFEELGRAQRIEDHVTDVGHRPHAKECCWSVFVVAPLLARKIVSNLSPQWP